MGGVSQNIDRYGVVFDDESLVADAGLLVAGTLMDRLGLEDVVDRVPLDGTCSTVVSGSSRRVALRPNTTYVFRAYRDAECSVDLATATQFGTPSAPQPPGDTTPVQVTPPDYFSDDEGSFFEPDINKPAAAGITNGCAPGLYCPELPTTRAQMAGFLTRALNLPVPAPENRREFSDVAGGVHRGDIFALAAAGITVGCNPEGTAYCPDDPVTRAQMAGFLTRALNLPVPAPEERREFSDIAGGVHRGDIFALAAAVLPGAAIGRPDPVLSR